MTSDSRSQQSAFRFGNIESRNFFVSLIEVNSSAKRRTASQKVRVGSCTRPGADPTASVEVRLIPGCGKCIICRLRSSSSGSKWRIGGGEIRFCFADSRASARSFFISVRGLVSGIVLKSPAMSGVA